MARELGVVCGMGDGRSYDLNLPVKDVQEPALKVTATVRDLAVAVGHDAGKRVRQLHAVAAPGEAGAM